MDAGVVEFEDSNSLSSLFVWVQSGQTLYFITMRGDWYEQGGLQDMKKPYTSTDAASSQAHCALLWKNSIGF